MFCWSMAVSAPLVGSCAIVVRFIADGARLYQPSFSDASLPSLNSQSYSYWVTR